MKKEEQDVHVSAVIPCRFRNNFALPFHFGYNVATMKYEIILSPEAVDDLQDLRASVRAVVRDAIEVHLRHQPAKTSKSRIKRLRGLSRPQFRLRVEDVRVFYDVTEKAVEVLAIVPKHEADTWLEKAGVPDETGGTD